MPNKPKVSIILPIYNVAEFLPKALDSAINQTLKEIEIICVDDCSTDGSYEIALEYAKKDNRIVVIRQETNQGEVVAKYIGAQVAKADYIGTIDPDDWVEPTMYEKMYNVMIEKQLDMVFCNFCFMEEIGTYIRTNAFRLEEYNGEPFIIDEKTINIINPGTPNKLHKKERFLNGLNFKERDIWKDVYQYYRNITEKECLAYFVEDCFYNYRQRHDSICHTPKTDKELYITFLKTIDLILKYLKENNQLENYKNAVKSKIYSVLIKFPKKIIRKKDIYSLAKNIILKIVICGKKIIVRLANGYFQ